MIFLLSPAKSLDYESPLNQVYARAATSQARFPDQTQALIKLLCKIKPTELSDLMGISTSLADLNFYRFKAFSAQFTPENSRPAFWAFDGDVYDGLQAKTLSANALTWAQKRVRMLSGLYGVLRPLDLMQPYRLEMGTTLPNKLGKNLYSIWQTKLAFELNADLKDAGASTVVNLASEEYFKSVDMKQLNADVVQPIFQERKNKANPYKVVSFNAKRARGLMTRFAIDNRLETPSALQGFRLDGYAFAKGASDSQKWVFRRDLC